jgi:hypothetical protein
MASTKQLFPVLTEHKRSDSMRTTAFRALDFSDELLVGEIKDVHARIKRLKVKLE